MKIIDLKCAIIGRNPVVRIATDEGLSGYGEVEHFKPYIKPCIKPYVLALKDALVGEDPTDVERCMLKIRPRGAFKPFGAAVSVVEHALWDVAGKAAGLPVHKLLGGKVRDRVRVYNGAVRVPLTGHEPEEGLSMEPETARIADTARRLKKLYAAAVYDIMDEMGLRHQCLDLAIKPIDRSMRVAGPAFTIAGMSDSRSDEEFDDFPEVKDLTFFRRMYPGCVVVIAVAGETRAGHWGELMSTAAKARGAAGVIIDGGTRDGNLLMDIPDWPVFARYLSPIESKLRYRIRALEKPIAMAGSLTSHVRVNPGDWLFGDMDGVVVIPVDRVDEVLAKAEEISGIEDTVRDEIRAGADVKAVFDKYGRL